MPVHAPLGCGSALGWTWLGIWDILHAEDDMDNQAWLTNDSAMRRAMELQQEKKPVKPLPPLREKAQHHVMSAEYGQIIPLVPQKAPTKVIRYFGPGDNPSPAWGHDNVAYIALAMEGTCQIAIAFVSPFRTYSLNLDGDSDSKIDVEKRLMEKRWKELSKEEADTRLRSMQAPPGIYGPKGQTPNP